jgi:predicted transglutaminase-like cysteine proteinase
LGSLAGLAIGLALCLVPAGAVERPGLSQRKAAPKPLEVTTDNGPRFFTIRQVLDKRAGKPPAPETDKLLDGSSLRLTYLPGEDTMFSLRIESAAPFTSVGYQIFPSANAGIGERWTKVQAEWAKERAALQRCADNPARCGKASAIFVSIRRQAADLDRDAKIDLVNARVNAGIVYQSDFARHSQWDHWSPPLKTLGQAGDCEDYAIAKFYLLRDLGIPDEDMRIVLLKDRKAGEDHAVLAVRGAYAWHLLDNRFNALESDVNTPHYRPVIALNSTRHDLFAAPYVEIEDYEIGLGMALRPASSPAAPEATIAETHLRGTLD